jgi:hypothetical protein
VMPWPELAAWGAGTLAVLTLAGWLATRTMIASRRASRSSRAPGPAGGEVPSGSVAG